MLGDLIYEGKTGITNSRVLDTEKTRSNTQLHQKENSKILILDF